MKKRDLLLIAGILIAAAALWLILRPASAGSTVLVTVDGKQYASLPLDRDAELLIESADGGENLLVISGGEAEVVSSNCKNGVCVDTGAVSGDGELIVCLPHKVVIEIVG